MTPDGEAARRVDIAVVGAGPAGMAAATAAAEGGARTLLLDEQRTPGGQIYRALADAPETRARRLGPDYLAGRRLLDALATAGVEHVPGASVWELTAEGTLTFSVSGAARQVAAERVILATGATERPMPFPGWTLPGVMTAGAGQILLKSAALLPPAPVVLAGSGPLLLLLAVQYLDAGLPLAALVETTPARGRHAALRHLAGAVRGRRLLAKGVRLLWRLRRSGIAHHRGATELRALGEERVEALAFRSGGREHRLDCAALLVHSGVVPNLQISRSLRLAHEWDPLQLCWRPRLDAMGRSSAERILIAGDGAGIAGADAAVPAGRLAAHAALADLGRASESDAIGRERAALRAALAPRPFLDVLYAPAPEFLDPPDETVVCRCEEVTAGQIRGFVDLGCLGPNQAKAYGRCGMGPCQGRYCALTVSSVVAARRGVSVEEVGALRIRPPIKPVTIGELASLAPTEEG